MPGSVAEEAAARRLLDLYAEAQVDMQARVQRRLDRGITEAGWTERKLLETAELERELGARVTELAGRSAVAVEAGVRDAYADAQRSVAARLGGALPGPATPPRAVMALERSLRTGLAGTHFRILRSNLDVYREVVGEAARMGAIGVATRRQLAADMTSRLYARGVTGFIDRRGRSWSLDAYTEMASRTVLAQAHLAGTVDRLGAYGLRLAKVSDAPEECELCRPWEGKVLQISGPRTGEHPTLDDAKSAGLFHPRCKHNLGAYVPELADAVPPPGSAVG